MSPSITLRSTCYNHQKFVMECLDSVADQDSGDFEWLIVDDASTDDSAEIINAWLLRNRGKLRDKAIAVEFIRHERNVGFTATLNEIVQRATGDCLCGISCDDRLLPHRISTVRRIMASLPPGCVGSYGDAFLINAVGDRTGARFIESHRPIPLIPQQPLFETLLAGNFIPAPSVVLFRNVLLELGGYDESLPYEDYDLWLRLTRRYQLALSNEPTLEYRIHGENFHLKFQDWRQANYWIYRKHLDLPSGAVRFLGNLKGILKHQQLNAQIRDDVLSLQPHNLPGWEKTRQAVLESDPGSFLALQ
jgi:glycosyltransferase involved in cell wall biosynthesis